MAALISFQGSTASFDGRRWHSADETFRQLCEDVAALLPHDYHPDPINGPARAVARQLGGRVVRVALLEPDCAPADAQY